MDVERDNGLRRDKIAKKSFVSLFKDNRTPDLNAGLQFVAPPEGEMVFSFEHIDTVENSLGFCLIGCVIGPRPKAYALAELVRTWGKNIKFQMQKNGWIKFNFPDAAERDRILKGGPYMILGKQLFLKLMPRCFLYDEDELYFIPSWVQIHGLPADCWTNFVISSIASIIGKPLYTDRLTCTKQFTDFARVLVEVDVKKPRIHEYSVRLPTGKKATLTFKYEFLPKFCASCNSAGHETDFCEQFWENDAKRRHMERQRRNARRNARNDNRPGAVVAETSEAANVQGNSEQIHNVAAAETAEPRERLAEPQNDPLDVMPPDDALGQEDGNIDIGVLKQPDPDLRVDLFGGTEQLADYVFETDHGSGAGGSDFDDSYLSPVDIQDREEWLTTKKKKRNKKGWKFATPLVDYSFGNSSVETEYVRMDPSTRLPLAGTKPFVAKVKDLEVWPPDTASGSP